MIVPITVVPPNAFSPKLPPSIAKLGHDELFLIELQGTLDVQGAESTVKDRMLIGTLNISDMNKPTLTIGHHLLEGKVVHLPKPLGVLHKHVASATVHAFDADDPEKGEGEKEQEHASNVRWNVTAVVKKKIVFSKRPMPIAKPPSASRRI